MYARIQSYCSITVIQIVNYLSTCVKGYYSLTFPNYCFNCIFLYYENVYVNSNIQNLIEHISFQSNNFKHLMHTSVVSSLKIRS